MSVDEIRCRKKLYSIILGVFVWMVPLIAIAVMIALDPTKRSVTPVYHAASASWQNGQDLYSDQGPWHYLPHFAVLFMPFHWLPLPAGEIAWRVVCTLWLAWGTWQLVRLDDRPNAGRVFVWASLLAMPACLGAMRNGQANTLFAAVTVQAAVCLIGGRWRWAAALLVTAVAIKPIGARMLLLAPFGYRRVAVPLIVALLALVAFPFLTASPDYVISQMLGAKEHIVHVSQILDHRFANVAGILRSLGLDPPSTATNAMGLVAAIVTLGVWVLGSRRVVEPDRGLFLLSLATVYLMLFNPMNESNSYVIVAPAMAVVALRLLDLDKRSPVGWAMVAIVLTIGLLADPLRGIAPDLSLWYKPLVTMGFIAMLVFVVTSRSREGDSRRIKNPVIQA